MNLQSASSINASQVVQQVKMPSKNTIILQQGQGGTLQVCMQLQEVPQQWARKFRKFQAKKTPEIK